MNLQWLDDFIALADLRSFSKAAQVRHVTQPAFSRRIRALENWAGAELFRRTPQGAELTPAGRSLARDAPPILRSLAQMRADARRAGGREASTLRIAATHALSFTFLPRWIQAVGQRSQLGPMRLVSDSMARCESLLMEGEVQFLLCHHHPAAPLPLAPDKFPSTILGHDRLIPVAAPDERGKPRWDVGEDGTRFPYLGYTAESGIGRIVGSVQPVSSQRWELAFSAHLAATLMALAREGRGVAWVPETLAQPHLQEGTLVPAGPQHCAITAEICLFRHSAEQSGTAEALWAAACVAADLD